MAKARFVPGRAVYGTLHRASRNTRRKRTGGSAELSVAGLVVWVVAFIVFYFIF
jgi:hypothetical protein